MIDWRQQHGDHGIFLALHGSFPYLGSGYAVRSHAIAKHLLRHGVDLTVYTRPGFPSRVLNDTDILPQDEVDGVIYRRLPNPAPELGEEGKYYRDMAQREYAKAIRQSGASIVHAASNMENGLPAIRAGKQLGLRTVYEYRGMWHYTRSSFVPWFTYTEEYAARHALELQVGKEADAVLAISEALRNDLVNNGLDGDKITVLPNAVDVDRFTPVPADAALRRKLNLEGRIVVGFIGSVTAYEGLDLLLDAVVGLNAAGKKISLLIVGGGRQTEHQNYMEHLKRLHTVRGKPPCVIFTGIVPFNEVQRYYSIIDIIALPRINSKVCQCVPPLKPLEAMAMGKALVVSNVAALREIVRHDETGLICQADSISSLTDQLARLLDEPKLRIRLTENALDWVRRERDWTVVSQRILKVYQKLL